MAAQCRCLQRCIKEPAELESGLMTLLAADGEQVSDQGLGVLAGLHC